MKKLFFMLMMIFLSMASFAQVRAKVVIGHQPPHRHHVVVRHRRVVHHRWHRRHGARVVVRGRL